MGQDSKIGWTTHTFAALRGCVRVEGSPACQAADGGVSCYAEAMARRNPKVLGSWGPEGTRVFGVDAYWAQPLKWNAVAEKVGVPALVFTTSMGDWFEGDSTRNPDGTWTERRGGVRDDYLPHLARLWALMDATPWLRWQVLTKRPWNMARYARTHGWPANAWAGVTVENQAWAHARIPYLLRTPAAVRFLSIEPMVGSVDLDPAICSSCGAHGDALGLASDGATPWCPDCDEEAEHGHWLDGGAGVEQPGIAWVIVGAESAGPREGKRRMDLDWVRGVRRQCTEHGIPLFVKQAAVDGRIVHGPEIDGRAWQEFPLAI